MKYISHTSPLSGAQETEYLERIVIKVNRKYIFIETDTIQYIKASGYYAEIFTESGERYVYRISMAELAEKLNPTFFSRVNRSAIIHRNYVKEVVSEGQGEYSIVMTDRTSFPLSKTQKGPFLEKMGIRP